ncbi:MAG TPA: N-acetyl-alpha-D-glucosaminyl L-malate synthase BshA [Candidatus Polarisedimenticolia bacterium]|nr:N-acetyl-alpha-D-glucosaminyl L-malate synthase BshA [Candidatus Polarisedimenticolia bacterium]
MGERSDSPRGTDRSARFGEALLKLAIVCYPSVGGSGILASQLGQQLGRRGHEVHFVAYGPPFRLDPNAPNVRFHPVRINEYELFRYPDYTLPLSVALADVSREFGLDLIHAHYAVPHAVAAYLARRMLGAASPRLITTLHGTDTTLLGKDPSYRPIIRHAIAASDGVTAVSAFLRDETRQIFGIDREIDVVHNFFAPQKPKRSRSEVRASLGVGSETVALHMSNLRSGKRIEDLLAALARVRNGKRLRLLVLAGGDFAPYRPLVESLGIQDRVIVRGAVPDVEDYLAASDFGVYTSESESFGLSILESMFHGHPVLATRAGGVPEVVVDGETGFLLPPGDVGGFAARMEEMAEDPERFRAMGERGRARAEALFSADRIVDRYLEVYRRVLSEPERSGL